MNKGGIIEKLKRVDEDLFFEFGPSPAKKPYVVIVGGGAVMLRGLSDKMASKDIDVFKYEEAAAAYLFSDPDINAQSGAYELNMPYGYEDRLVEVDLGLRSLRVFTPSAEDLAVMKLYRWEEPDKIDLYSPEFVKALDWGLLEKIVYDPDEALGSRVCEPRYDSEYRRMADNFEEYKRKCHGAKKL